MLAHGPKRLTEKAPCSAWLKFFDQFRSALVVILMGVAVLAGVVGDLKDALIIATVVVLNAMLGFFQEHRAEAALTGESRAMVKSEDVVDAQAVLAQRHNMVFMNTVVTRGRLESIVTATGMATEMGHIAGLLAQTAESATPQQIQLDVLGKRLAAIAGVVVGLIFAIGLLRGDELVTTAITAIALAVAAIPEGLPAVVTVTLALGMHRMAKRHAIVKKMAAVETLGCTTVICSDKTGTLTPNQMTARQVIYGGRRFDVSGEGYDSTGAITATDGAALPKMAALLQAAALYAEARIREGELIGDPAEGVLLVLAAKGG